MRHVTKSYISCDFGRTLDRWQQLFKRSTSPPARSAAVAFSSAATTATSSTSSERFVTSTQQTGRNSRHIFSLLIFLFWGFTFFLLGNLSLHSWNARAAQLFQSLKILSIKKLPSGQHKCTSTLPRLRN